MSGSPREPSQLSRIGHSMPAFFVEGGRGARRGFFERCLATHCRNRAWQRVLLAIQHAHLTRCMRRAEQIDLQDVPLHKAGKGPDRCCFLQGFAG
jgi:hypothetical protein